MNRLVMTGPRAICLGSNCRVHGPEHLCDNCRANEYIDQLERELKMYKQERAHKEEAARIKMSDICGLPVTDVKRDWE
jgi:hypothetical protein